MELLVSQRVKDLRKSLKLSQNEFAKPLGVTQATICAIETAKSGYSMELLNKISEVYKKDITYFLVENPTKEKIKVDDTSIDEKLMKIKYFFMGKFGIKTEQWDEALDELFSAKYRVYSSFQK